jgi:protein ImuB
MFACLFVPDFSVQAVLRLEPEDKREVLKQSPIAILEGPASMPRVTGMNDAARRAGIELDMTKLQVETCGRVWLRKRSVDHENAAQSALQDCAAGFSPRVESTAPGTVILDLAGTEKLHGGVEIIGRKIAERAAEFGFDLNIAFAANPDSAFYAARGFAGISILPAGEEAERLAALPVEVLSASSEMPELLDIWGIRNFRDLASLPPIPLVERLGQEGLRLQNIARAETRRTLVPVEPAVEFTECFEFDDPVETLESLTFILNRLIQQVCARLTARSLATNELRLKLELGSIQHSPFSIQPAQHPDRIRRSVGQGEGTAEDYERTWKLPLPVQDHKVFFRLACLDLENQTQTAPIRKITVEAMPIKPRHAQSGLFVPASPEAEQLEIALSRIRGVVGSADENGIACVGSPCVLDSHKPDSFTVQPFLATSTQQPAISIQPAQQIGAVSTGILPGKEAAAEPVICLRMFRPPLETRVEFSENKPASVVLYQRQYKVLAASGPWRNSGNWWNRSAAWARNEWDVALKTAEGVGFYRIYLDRITNRWFVEGGFD